MISEDLATLQAGAVSLRGAYTSHERLERILRLVKTMITRKNSKSEGPVHALVGLTRSGKSQLLKALFEDSRPDEVKITAANGDFAYQKPVVYLKFTAGKVIDLLDSVYEAITGKDAAFVLGAKRSTAKVLGEISRHRTECGVRLLVLDEAHQSILNRTDFHAGNVAKIVKDLSNEYFSVLVVGTPEETIRLINADPELQSRCHKIHRIEPFKRSPVDMHVWTNILRDIDLLLKKRVFGRLSGLAAPQMAEALMEAAEGVVGHMATLTENAVTEALDEWDQQRSSGSKVIGAPVIEKVEWRHFSTAFSEWAPGQGRANPFEKPGDAAADKIPASETNLKKTQTNKASGVKGKVRQNAVHDAFKA